MARSGSIAAVHHQIVGLLSGRRSTPSRAARGRDSVLLIALLIAAGMIYGAAMGSFDIFQRLELNQVLFSAIKVPLLLAITFALSLPSFFVLNTLLGVRDDFGRSLGALIQAQAAMTVILAAFAPLTLFWYVTWGRYEAAILFNAAMFAVATLASRAVLRRAYAPLIAVRPVHLGLMRTWMGIYAFVGIQMGWVMRPFIGTAGRPVRFFPEESWGNAYVKLVVLVGRLFGT